MGWTTLKNGELLVLASAQFDVFVTVDLNRTLSLSLLPSLCSRREPTDSPISGPSCPASSRPSRPPRRARRNLSASLEQMALNLRCPFVTPRKAGVQSLPPGLNRGMSGEAFTLDPRIRENDNSKWSKPALARHVHDLVRRSHQYRGSRELTARLKGQLPWTADIRATGFEQRHRPVDRVSYRETGIVHR